MTISENENWVYILSESELDETFYNICAERINNQTYKLIDRRYRPGGGISHVRRSVRLLLKDIQHSGSAENTFFIIAVDNDRRPAHPEHKNIPKLSKLFPNQQYKICRFCEIQKSIGETFGEDRLNWPIPGAIAVPVQMIESWLLLISNPKKYSDEKSLPNFSWKTDSQAVRYYAPKAPDPQLKDLKQIEMNRLDIGTQDKFYLNCAELLNPTNLADRSSSFALFKEQVENWIRSV